MLSVALKITLINKQISLKDNQQNNLYVLNLQMEILNLANNFISWSWFYKSNVFAIMCTTEWR